MIRVDEPAAQEHHQGAPPEEGGQRCSENRSEDEMDGGPHGTAIIFTFIKITASRSDQQHLSSPQSPKIRWTPSREGYRSSSTPSWGRRSRNCGRRRARRSEEHTSELQS